MLHEWTSSRERRLFFLKFAAAWMVGISVASLPVFIVVKAVSR